MGCWSPAAASHAHSLSQLFYRYDVDGRLFQVVRNRLSDNYKYYHYIITNSFGDVLQIRDGNGNILAKFQLLKNIYNAVINAYNTYSNNFDPWYIVISTILSFLCSKYLKTESVYYKFNFNRVSKSAKDLAKNFKKLNAKRINKFIELVTNQIVYYLKNNTTLYKRFIKNYSLINVSSWISKMPELARQIKTMFKEIKT